MAHPQHTPSLSELEEVVSVLFCLVDDAYRILNPRLRRYESLKRLSDSEVISLALLQQLRGVQSERSFLRDAQRFFSHLFAGVAGMYPSSFNRRVRKLRRFLEPLRRQIVRELVGDPETLVVDSTLLSVLHPRQVEQSVGFVQRLRGQAAPALRYQPGSRLLRAHPRQRGGRLPDRGTRSRGGFGGRGSKEALRGPGLPQRGARGCPGRNGDPARERTLPTAREQAAGGDSASEPQARVPPRGDVGNHPRGARQQDRGESYGLHVWLLRQPPAGPSSRSHQGAVGLRSSQHSSRVNKGWGL